MAGGVNESPVGTAYTYPTKTLAQLRTEFLTLMGFPSPLLNPDSQTQTFLFLKTSVLNALGFADPLTSPDAQTKTLLELREIIIRRTGRNYAVGANAPGVDEITNSFINEAHQTVFRMAELDKGGTAMPSAMTADGHSTVIDYVPVLALALGLAKAHAGQQDSQSYFDQLTKYLADRAARRPPNVDDQIGTLVNEAQQAVFRLIEMDRGGLSFPAMMTADGDTCSLDYHLILSYAIGLAKAHYKQEDAKVYFDRVTKYVADVKNRRPPNIDAMATKWLQLAQNQLYMRYGMLRTERWFPITLQAAKRLYYVPTITGENPTPFSADFRRVSEVWIKDGTRWLPMVGGINPANFTNTAQSIPTNYEFREYFEVWPEPEKAYTVYLKGHFGLRAFESDSDTVTIDPEPVLMQAVVWGKAHYGHPDALNWLRDMNTLIGRLNAGTFASNRYIPRPSFIPKPDPYPSVTFSRV